MLVKEKESAKKKRKCGEWRSGKRQGYLQWEMKKRRKRKEKR